MQVLPIILSHSLFLSLSYFLLVYTTILFLFILFCFFETLNNKRIVFRLSQSLHVLRVLLIVLHNVCSAFLYFFFFFLLAVNYQTSLFYCCFVLLFVLFVCWIWKRKWEILITKKITTTTTTTKITTNKSCVVWIKEWFLKWLQHNTTQYNEY